MVADTEPTGRPTALVGLAELYRARVGTALGLRALLRPVHFQQEPNMDWLLEVYAPDGGFWFRQVSIGDPRVPYARSMQADPPIRVGYFAGEAECVLAGFGTTAHPCLRLEAADDTKWAIRVWDITGISRVDLVRYAMWAVAMSGGPHSRFAIISD